jgi:hypothetical protein
MPTRGQKQLICSALLGALVMSCAAPPVYVVAPPAPRAEHEQRGGQQAEQAPVEQQQPAEQQQPPVEQQQPLQRPPVVVVQPPVVSQPGPASQGGGGVAQVPDPGSQQRQPTGGQRRPSGNAPGVRHDIPAVNTSDLADSDNWTQQMQDACAEVGVHDSDCPTFDIRVFKKDKTGKETAIHNPGPGYGSAYDSCPVKSINPQPPNQGGPKLVSAGTVIRVKVVCIPADTNQNNTKDQLSVVQQDNTPSNTPKQQSNTGNNKNKQDGSGQTGTSQQQSGKKQGKISTESGSGG